MTITIGKISAVRHDGNDVARLRHELRNAGVHEQYHEAVLAGCRAANILNDRADASDIRDQVHAASAVSNNDMPLAERIEAAAANPKKKEATRFALALLKRLQIPVEACESRATLDAALKEKSLDERFQCKSALAFASILQ